jgi:hypothetical protein
MAAAATTTHTVEFISLPVAISRREYVGKPSPAKEFARFMKAPPFYMGTHEVSLRVGHGEPLPDMPVDPVWLAECNAFLMGLDHRDAILIDHYLSYQYSSYLRTHRGSGYTDFCVPVDTRDIRSWAVLALLCSGHPDEAEGFAKFVKEQFTVRASDAFCDALWKIATATATASSRREMEKSIHKNMATLERRGLTKLLRNIAPDSPFRAAHKTSVMKEGGIRFYTMYTRFAFQLVDLLAEASQPSALFHELDARAQAAFAIDMAAFRKTRSYVKRYAIFSKYVYYFKASNHMRPVLKAAVERVQALFERVPPLRKPLTVYRGVVDNAWVKKGTMVLKGLTSTTLRALIGSLYADEQRRCCLMRIHVPAGRRVLPTLGLTDGNYHMEIVLPDNAAISRTTGPEMQHVRGEDWPHWFQSNKGNPMWVYDFAMD